MSIHNCPNCGAPIRGVCCEYCGTVFEVEAPVYQPVTSITFAFMYNSADEYAELNGAPCTKYGRDSIRYFDAASGTWRWRPE